ncbi:MAG: hypothetical protein KDE28_12955, partial [Anaerolineales bacterium]|nr:hypothetical protein [Anaerolineales bacterium]
MSLLRHTIVAVITFFLGLVTNLITAIIENSVGTVTIPQVAAMAGAALLFFFLIYFIENPPKRRRQREVEALIQQLEAQRDNLRNLQQMAQRGVPTSVATIELWLERQREIKQTIQALVAKGTPVVPDPIDTMSPPALGLSTRVALGLKQWMSILTLLLVVLAGALLATAAIPDTHALYLTIIDAEPRPVPESTATPEPNPTVTPTETVTLTGTASSAAAAPAATPSLTPSPIPTLPTDLWPTELLVSFDGASEPVRSVLWSEDEQYIGIFRQNQIIEIWDATANELILTITDHATDTDRVPALIFSPDGQRVVSGADDGQPGQLWDLTTGERIATLEAGPEGWFYPAEFSQDGSRLLTANPEHDVILRDAGDGAILATLSENATWGWRTAHEGEQELILARDWPADTISLWDFATGSRRQQFPLASDLANASSSSPQYGLSPDGRWVIIVHVSELGSIEVQLWDSDSGNLVHSYLDEALAEELWYGFPQFSADSRYLTVASVTELTGTGRLLLWDLTATEPVATFTTHSGQPYPVFLPTAAGTRLVINEADSSLWVDPATGEE